MSVDVDEQVEKDTLEASEGPVQPAGESLRLKVIRGASWELIGQFAMQFIRFGGNLILTRLLLPDAFGVMGMVQVFMISLTLLADVGLHVSVMYDPRGDDDDFLNTVWSVSLVRGLLLFGVSCLFAYPFAHFYGMPDLVWLIPITGLSSIFRGASSTSLLSAGRHLQRKWSVTVECGSQIAGSIITVILTLITCSVYGLAWGWVVTSIIYFVMSFCDSARRPHRFHWDNEIVRSLTSYGRWLWLCGGLTILTQQSDRLTLGTMITAGVLGNYVIGKNLASLPMIIFYRIMSGIAQPLYASIQHLDSKEFRRKARKLRLGILVTHMPVLFGMAILGKPLVNLLYEGSYSEAGWFCTISAIGSMFIVATDMGDVFASFGDGRTHFKLTFVRSLGLAISLSVGCLVGQHFGHADHGVLFGIMLAPLVYYPIQSIFYRSIGVWLPDIDAIGLSVPLVMLFCLYMGWI